MQDQSHRTSCLIIIGRQPVLLQTTTCNGMGRCPSLGTQQACLFDAFMLFSLSEAVHEISCIYKDTRKMHDSSERSGREGSHKTVICSKFKPQQRARSIKTFCHIVMNLAVQFHSHGCNAGFMDWEIYVAEFARTWKSVRKQDAQPGEKIELRDVFLKFCVLKPMIFARDLRTFQFKPINSIRILSS